MRGNIRRNPTHTRYVTFEIITLYVIKKSAKTKKAKLLNM